MSNLPARPRWYPIPTGNHDRDETDRRVLDMIYAEQDGRTNVSQALARQAQENQSLKASVAKLVAFVGSLKGFGAISEAQQITSTFVLTPVNASGTPASNPLSNSGANTTISVASTVWTFPPAVGGSVTYNSGSTDPGGIGTWYVYADDPFFQGGAVTYHATGTNPVVTGAEGRVYFGKITIVTGTGSTGGGGGGGACWAGDTLIQTPDRGNVSISALTFDDKVVTLGGVGYVENVIEHAYQGIVVTLPSGARATPTHHVLCGSEWAPVGLLYLNRSDFTGSVFNLEIDGDPSYVLADGTVAHNALK